MYHFPQNGCVEQKYAQSTKKFSPCGSFSFIRTYVAVVNLKGGFRSFSFSGARQWFSVHLNHVQIVTELARSLSRGRYRVGLDL